MSIQDELEAAGRKLAEVERMGRVIEGGDATPCDTLKKNCDTSFAGPRELTPGQSLDDLERELTLQQRRAIDLISTGQSAVATADALGVHRATLYRWRQEPAFAAVLKRRQDELYAAAVDQMRGSLVKAIRTVSEELDSRSVDGRLRAAYRLLPYVGSPKLRPAEETTPAADPPPDAPQAAAPAGAPATAAKAGDSCKMTA